MSAFLYTFKIDWEDYDQATEVINSGESYDTYWNCGGAKNIKEGDVFFLMKLGKPPKGIIGFGHIHSTPYLHDWRDNESLIKPGMVTRVLFKQLSQVPIVELDELKEINARLGIKFTWTPRNGGAKIPEILEAELLSIANKKFRTKITYPTEQEVNLYKEGKCREVTINTYDRSSQARRDCIKVHGHRCAVCGFNFRRNYGPIGHNYIEVHHLNPISKAGGEHPINPKEDLRPVCANCHRMLHKRNPPFSIKELKTEIKLSVSKEIVIVWSLTKRGGEGDLPKPSEMSAAEKTDLRRLAIFNLNWEDYQYEALEGVTIERAVFLYDGISHCPPLIDGMEIKDDEITGYPHPVIKFTLSRPVPIDDFCRSVSESSMRFVAGIHKNNYDEYFFFEDHNGYTKSLQGDELVEAEHQLQSAALLLDYEVDVSRLLSKEGFPMAELILSQAETH